MTEYTTAQQQDSAPQSADEKIAALQAKVDALEAQKAAETGGDEVKQAVLKVMHWLHLADGTVAESSGAVPTHVSKEDGTTVPVIAAYLQQKADS